MEENKKFIIKIAEDWTESPSDQDIINLVLNYSSFETYQENGLRVSNCYLNKRVLRTSEDKNEDYNIYVYRLDWAEDLQMTVAQDFVLSKNQVIIFHRIRIIRDGVLIDKIADTTFRVFDNEQTSSYGYVNKEKKVHCIINDLRLGDVFIIEYSLVNVIAGDNLLDKKYYRNLHFLPQNNWVYKKYIFKFIQNRECEICIKKRYFRNEVFEIIDEQKMIFNGEFYIYEKTDFKEDYGNNYFTPFFEIVTVATWDEIVTDHLPIYNNVFVKKDETNFLNELFDKIIYDAESLEEKIKKIIEYVQNQIVYIFDAEVMHDYVPQSLKTTIEKQSGDCKAKSYLLVNLLSKLNIDASLILVNHDMGFYAANELPSAFIFNHAIVKVYYKDNIYFVDPTWSGRCGLIDYRSQPLLAYYLEIKTGVKGGLQEVLKEDVVPNCLEENVTINIKNKHCKIEAEAIYRFISADNYRKFLRENSLSRVIQSETEYHYKKLQYPNDQSISEYISDATCDVVYDNDQKNEIKVLYIAKLLKPYGAVKKPKVFKYYYSINTENIDNIVNKDAIIESIFELGRKFSLTISSNKFYDFLNKTTRRSVEIDNDYFFFSNKKKLSLKTLEVFSEFRPKGLKAIRMVDVGKIKQDCQKINDSNFGVGIVYSKRSLVSLSIMVLYVIYLILVAINN